MPISEAARHDLYNGLSDLLGPNRAETLMAYLPEYDPNDVATKSDIADLKEATKSDIADLKEATKSDIADLKEATKSDIADLKEATKSMQSDIGVLESRLTIRLDRVDTRIDGLGSRLDRLFVTLVAGLFVIVAAMAGFVFTTL